MSSSTEHQLRKTVMAARLLVSAAKDSIGLELEVQGWGSEATGSVELADVDEAALARWKRLLLACQALEATLGFVAAPDRYPLLLADIEAALDIDR